MAKLFGTSGIRGYTEYTGKDDYVTLSDEFCSIITKVFIKHINKDGEKKDLKIAVGMDFRNSSPRIQKIILNAIEENNGIPVNCGVTPTPALTYFVKHSDCVGGIMITGSHIKESMNGLKFINDREEISKEEEKSIEEIYSKEITSQKENNNNFKKTDVCNQLYIDFLKSKTKNYQNLKIILDVRNSCHANTFPEILSATGAEVIQLKKILQEFKALDTDSTENENPEMKQAILSSKADIGVTFDSDGDRLSVYDENGNVVQGDLVAAILADILPIKKIVVPINVTSLIDTIGKTVIRSKVGSPFVVQAMKENSADFGFEANGGCIFAEVMLTRDGGYPAVCLLNVLAEKKQKSPTITISKICLAYPQFHVFRTKFDCPTTHNEYILKNIREKYLSENKHINDTDGLKVYFDDTTWILFRPSSNSPEFRIFVESLYKETTTTLAEDALKLARGIMNEAEKLHKKLYK